MNHGLIHKISILCKDYYTIRTIDDLFGCAGAEDLFEESQKNYGSQRKDNVYGWIAGIKKKAPEKLDKIIQGVISQLLLNENIPEEDKIFLKNHFDGNFIQTNFIVNDDIIQIPQNVEKLLEILIKGLRRSMYPLCHRRKNLPNFKFDNEYDLQDLLHALMRPWIKDIRTEEYTPSYAASSTRFDFLLPDYKMVIETKIVRSKAHAKKIGDELIIDIDHYQVHENCCQIWNVIFDSFQYIQNPKGLINDLDGERKIKDKTIKIKTFII